MSNNKGVTLLIVIIIVVIAAIVVLGVTSFISSGLALNIARLSMEGALYAAQAGVYSGLYDYLQDPAQSYWNKVRNMNLIDDKYYSVGRDANFLLIDASNPQIASRMLKRIPLSNINETQSITANEMIVEWHNFSGALLESVTLGTTVYWTGSAGSGQRITLAPPGFQLSPKQSFTVANNNIWEFNTNIPSNATILVTFFFIDGSSRKAYLLNLGKSGNIEFSISATGELRGATNWERSIEATYDISTNKITSWQEITEHI